MTLPVPPNGGADLWLLRQPKPEEITGVLDLTELDEAEQGRASACRRQSGGFLYASAHIALRRVLSAYVGTEARTLQFGRAPCPCCDAPHGRPVLTLPDAPLHFSLSHSSGMALIGVSDVEIGVDVEKLPSVGTTQICAPALHPAEQAELAQAPAEAGTSAFGQLWTRKEAYLKGLGTGLSRDLATDYLGLDPSRRPPDWTVHDVPCGPRHTAAVAVHHGGPTGPVRLHWLPMECLYNGAPTELTPGDLVLTELAA
ncbi:4'-phosphopantetheinyl transferase family protein [Streptomyces sp. NPDC006879]|uniref:4'-phosphopantetheinyl transferase family protein n=1 Tax=Streptomyces sp. NPDC006879 TaxID=3364767 RepID=UPI0036AD6A40